MTDASMDFSTILDNLDPMFWHKGRLQTYKYWPFKDSEECNRLSMSRAGFFCIGGQDEPDLVQCFMCNKQLDGWESSDNPWNEHKKHQGDCPFINLNKPDEGSITLKELFYLLRDYYKQKHKSELENSIKDLKKEWKEAADTIPDLYEAMKESQKISD